MEIKVHKLIQLMDLMKPVVPKKPTLGVLAYIKLGDGKAVATDLETMVISELPEAQEPMLLPFTPVMDLVKYISGFDTIKIEAKDRKITLSWNGGSASYPTEDEKEFPILPELPVKGEESINGDALMPAILAALPYAAQTPKKGANARPVLEGVTLVLGNPIEVAAGDGFRMSHQTLGLSFPLEEKVVVPVRSVAILSHVFNKTPRTPPTNATSLISVITAKRQLRVALVGNNKMQVDFGKTASVIVNLVEGNPPEWLALIPKDKPALQSQLFAPQLEAAVRRVTSIAKGGAGIVRMLFADGKVTVSAYNDDQEIRATIDVLNTQGEPGRIAVNYTYLLDVLAGKQGVIVLCLYGEEKPLAFQYQQSPRVIVMPMLAAWPDRPAAAAEETPAPADETDEENPETGETPEPESSAEEESGEEIEEPIGQEETTETTV